MELMLEPQSEQDLAVMIAGATGPLAVRGGGTRGLVRDQGGAVLSTARLRGIVLYEPGSLTMVVRAGTPLAEVEATLAAEGQRLAFEPMDHRPLLVTMGTPTIGGVAAANVAGPRRVQVGAARDHLIGVRFVDGTGMVVANGGRVMKNVTGYDLVKLMAGSCGTLGVLTELAFKLQAMPETEATVVLSGLDDADGIARLAQALGSPFDVSGAAHVPGAPGRTLVRVEGMAGSVAYRAAAIARLWRGGDIVTGGDSAGLWRDVRDGGPFAGRVGAVWRVSVKPSDGPAVGAAVRDGCPGAVVFYDWGGGLVWVLIPGDGADGVADGAAGLVRGAVARLGGHATLVRRPPGQGAGAEVPVFQPAADAVAALTRGLRQKFDPRGILNPGLMG